MPRPRVNQARVMAQVEELVPLYHRAVQEERAHELPLIQQQVADICGPHVVPILMNLIGRYAAEKELYKSALDEKQELIDRLLAAPRRVARLLGRIGDEVDDPAEPCWAIVEGPPHQAVRFSADLEPDEICAGLPDEPVWVWLVESMGAATVVGRIDPPSLLEVGMEQVMAFEGVVKGGDEDVK